MLSPLCRNLFPIFPHFLLHAMFFFLLQMHLFSLCFQFCEFPLLSKCYLETYFFWSCICTVSKWEECGFGLNKIGSRLQGNRRWQPVVLVEEVLFYLLILAVIFANNIALLYSHRKDVWYFYQKNCRRSKMMLYKVQRQEIYIKNIA